MTIDVARLMCIKSDTDRYRSELRVLAADAGLGGIYANYLFLAAKHLNNASRALAIAVLEAPAEEA